MRRTALNGGWLGAVLGLLLVAAAAHGDTLAVGPGKRFTTPSAAIAASRAIVRALGSAVPVPESPWA